MACVEESYHPCCQNFPCMQQHPQRWKPLLGVKKVVSNRKSGWLSEDDQVFVKLQECGGQSGEWVIE